MSITISVSEEVWRELISRKKPGQSFDGVLKELFKLKDKKEFEKK